MPAMVDDPVLMARFSKWANARLYAACREGLSPAALAEDRGAFFGSILGTLNHVLLVNILYRERLENGGRSHFTTLNDILHTDLEALAKAQAREDDWLIERVGADSAAGDLDEGTVGFYTLLEDPEYWVRSLAICRCL